MIQDICGILGFFSLLNRPNILINIKKRYRAEALILD